MAGAEHGITLFLVLGRQEQEDQEFKATEDPILKQNKKAGGEGMEGVMNRMCRHG